MRIMIKGGVWKNTEDEILKAAVMKYGLNQWARISSLLVRKSPKQCKARWYEWLDPSIKKTEWTREEDEKLLHLAKLMPTQWRTIAPIVGRTPAQCLERYEKLLDAAAAKDDTYDPADDPRRLRPGEIDPNPEAKPARPDPIDMDEDEKEMLSEARARLANTRGKKAKRKAREKALEEARRLAQLQKKRELTAAGIEMRTRERKRKTINYNAEVAFEKKPAMGFYDTGEEAQTSKEIGKEFKPVTLEELEGKRRKDIENALIKRDVDKGKQKERADQPGALAKAMELNDPSLQRRRGKLMLPAPQISEAELAAIAKGGGVVDMDAELADGAGGEATRRLLGDYQTPRGLATPMRTPRLATAGGQDRIMQEAQNLARLQTGQTPLFGGENPELHPSDFSGITPRNNVAATPNALALAATPAGAGALPGATPAGGRSIAGIGLAATPARSVAGTPLRTPGGGKAGATPAHAPVRDELGLNEPTDEELGAREARVRAATQKNELRSGLSRLPAPKNEYQIVVPEVEEDIAMDEDEGPAVEEDAAEVEARQRAAAKAREEAELRKRSQVLQRSLPRPISLALQPEVRPEREIEALPPREVAEQLLSREMTLLLSHDAAKYPIKEKKRDKKSKKRDREDDSGAPALEDFDESELEEAAALLRAETSHVRSAMGHDRLGADEYEEAWGLASRDFIFIPSKQSYNRAASATNSDRLASIQGEFEGVRKEMEKEAMRAAKLEAKAELINGGHMRIEAKLRQQAEELAAAAQTALSEQLCFSALAAQEGRAMPQRLAEARAQLAAQQQREKDLQERYKELTFQRDTLAKQVQAA
ncbi:hypothetical protein WJX72_008746 [[Myrmecia] bisecta]|uniref:Uncharacterized protein n=1 Tax=[Myrmecia] bisecta TaxID=41462 RepID=A0AAW1PWV2_9CHLO